MNKKTSALLGGFLIFALTYKLSSTEEDSGADTPSGRRIPSTLSSRELAHSPPQAGRVGPAEPGTTSGTSPRTSFEERAGARRTPGHNHSDSPSTAGPDGPTGSPWRAPGQCNARDAQGDRVAYFSEFEEAADSGDEEHTSRWRIWIAPDVSHEAVKRVHRTLDAAESLAEHYLDPIERPVAYVHSNVDALREHACVASSAVSYYDGAIHVALLDTFGEVATSIHHEFAHHLLTQMGFWRPLWLHEGFAQRFASEASGSAPITTKPIDLRAMVEPLGTGASQEQLSAFYAQSSDMLEFINQLPPLEGRRGYSALLHELHGALAQGVAVPEDLFVWAIVARGKNLVPADPVDFWEGYVASGGFTEATNTLIEQEFQARLQ